jgi:membrane-bound metal-dependent hydrolase YbcI (DUF457 family)
VIVGHLGVAAAAQGYRRGGALAWLLAAAMMPDAVDAAFVVAGSCNPHGLYSHTLPAVALIAAVTGGIAFLVTSQRSTGLLAAAMTLVHIPLDYVTGHKLFWPGGEIVGLQLYEHPMADFLLEATLLAAGLWILRSRRGAPRWAVGWPALIGLLLLQATIDIVGKSRNGVKPTACARVSATTG